GCVGGNGTQAVGTNPMPTMNTLTLTVDGGPTGATGSINHAYVTVKVCAPNSTTQCAIIDHVLLDTGSWGLRLVGSVLSAKGVTLTAESDASVRAIEECATFAGGQTWGPVALADVSLAAELANNVPVQVMDDAGTSAPPPATCGANGTLINSVTGFNANGVLGIGVFAQDCGNACVNAAVPLAMYYGCTSGAASVCTAENIALAAQVTNPVAALTTDNNGVVVNLPNLVNANGDVSDTGELYIGINTQADNALPATGLTVLGTDMNGDFTATYNGGTTVLPALIDSGADSFDFADPTIAVCSSGAFVGYYCPAGGVVALFAVNTGVGAYTNTSTVNFAVADPNISFVAGAASFADLGGGAGESNFIWGMPFFYGRKVYVGLESRIAGVYTGPYFVY
ncbi:MAG TPA: DUF3443 family protein, partial [Steroidobacteraceae bacterium]